MLRSSFCYCAGTIGICMVVMKIKTILQEFEARLLYIFFYKPIIDFQIRPVYFKSYRPRFIHTVERCRTTGKTISLFSIVQKIIDAEKLHCSRCTAIFWNTAWKPYSKIALADLYFFTCCFYFIRYRDCMVFVLLFCFCVWYWMSVIDLALITRVREIKSRNCFLTQSFIKVDHSKTFYSPQCRQDMTCLQNILLIKNENKVK